MIWNGAKEHNGEENFEVCQDIYMFSIVYVALRTLSFPLIRAPVSAVRDEYSLELQ